MAWMVRFCGVRAFFLGMIFINFGCAPVDEEVSGDTASSVTRPASKEFRPPVLKGVNSKKQSEEETEEIQEAAGFNFANSIRMKIGSEDGPANCELKTVDSKYGYYCTKNHAEEFGISGFQPTAAELNPVFRVGIEGNLTKIRRWIGYTLDCSPCTSFSNSQTFQFESLTPKKRYRFVTRLSFKAGRSEYKAELVGAGRILSGEKASFNQNFEYPFPVNVLKDVWVIEFEVDSAASVQIRLSIDPDEKLDTSKYVYFDFFEFYF